MAEESAGKIWLDLGVDVTGFKQEMASATNVAMDLTQDMSSGIETILNDTQRSMKSKAASIASIYRKQGMSASESMQKAWEQIERSGDNASKSFKKQMADLEKTANSSSNKLTKIFGKIGKAVVAAFAVTSIVNFSKECLSLGSDLAEVQNVVDVTFGGMSKSVNGFAKDAMNSFGLSETVAKKYMGQFGAMSKAFGNTEEIAYDQAASLTGLAGDVASFYNLTTDEAYTKLKSVFTGETESLKDLGVVMTQTALDEYALQKGMGKTTSEMSEQEKVALRLSFVQERLADASGDFARTSDGWANQTRVLSLRFDALKASIGRGLINLLTPVIRVLNELIERLQAAADAFAEFTGALFGNAGAVSGMSGITDASAALAENTESAAVSAIAIKKTLAGFDQINILGSGSNTESNTGDDTSGTVTSDAVSSTVGEAGAGATAANRLKAFLSEMKQKLSEIANMTGLSSMWDRFLIGVENTRLGVQNLFDIFQGGEAAESLETLKASFDTAFREISLTVTTIWGDAWEICTEEFRKFTEENSEELGSFFKGTSVAFEQYGTTVSGIIEDAFGSVREWWETDGKDVYEGVMDCISDVIEWVLALWNDCILPIIDHITAEVKRLWENSLKPLWDKLLSFITSLWNHLKMLWNGILKPFVDWIVDFYGPGIKDTIGNVIRFFMDFGAMIADVIGGVLDTLGGLLDFVTGVFTGDWEKAWEGIQKFFSGIWDTIWGTIKGVINMIIDGLNALWNGLYTALRGIINGVGDIVSGVGDLLGQDWGWEVPEHAPQIPRLATGGYVRANTPQLAVIGDNRHEGEIVAPESKIAEAVARGFAMVMSKFQMQGSTQNERPMYVTIKIGEDTLWEGFVDYHNGIVKRTGESPLLV